VLTDRQYDAAVSALGGPLTLIQGPPGTGKSEVILSLLVSIVLAGHSALLVSKNHRALDEVEERLARIVGDTPLLTRARDGDGERDTSLLAQMRVLADGDALPDEASAPNSASEVLALARQLLAFRLRRHRLTKLNLALSDAVERLERWDNAVPPAQTKPTGLGGLLRRLVAMLRRVLATRAAERRDDRMALAERVQVLRRELVDLADDPSAGKADALAEAVATEAAAALKRSAARVTTPDHAARQILADRLQALQFGGRAKAAQMTAEEARLVLRHRPIWAVSTLSAASRVPLLPAVFEYVIFDEASQCDIASALPLFARARKAVVVGDPMQLGFIPQLSVRQEHALMNAVGLGPAARHSVAQSINSLFDFVRPRGTASRHFLADQFRSDPTIVAYLNDAFYEGRLVAAQDERKARWPDGYKPGLAWHDVRGRPTREDGGNVNHAEADEIIRLLVGMIRERHFTGSIGVLSPFNTQVALLLRRIRTALSEAERRDLRVATIDRFQGGEADVVIFSLVVAGGVHPGALTFYDRERRRVNVAISRARALCLVVGDKEFARKSRVRTLAFLAEAVGRPPRPRDPFDSEWERRIHAALRRRGLEPIPQYPVGSRFLDFALDPEGRKLDVEVDGCRWHADPDGNRKVADRLRDRELIARGWKIRRFWVHELAEDMEKCVDLVERDLGRA
jgi:very-short-patch-repair endonuclease